MGSVKERKADYDLMAAVMICLGKEADSGTDLLKLLNVLLSTETSAQDKCQILEEGKIREKFGLTEETAETYLK